MRIELNKDYTTNGFILHKGLKLPILGLRMENRKYFYVVQYKDDVILVEKEYCSILL